MSRPRRRVVLASGLVLGVAGIAGAGLAAYELMPRFASLSGLASIPDFAKPRRREIKIGPVAEMPTIRDGVPEIVGPKAPVRVIATTMPAAAAPAPSPPQAAEVQATSAVRPDPIAALIRSEPEPRPSSQSGPAVPAPTGRQLAMAGPATSLLAAAPMGPVPAPLRQQVPVIAAAFAPAAPPTGLAAPAEPRATAAVPLPPPAPLRAVVARLEPKPDRPAAPRPRPVPATAPPAEAGPAPAAAAPRQDPEDDGLDVLGVKIPSIASTGRRIREAAEAIGDAVTSLPGRL